MRIALVSTNTEMTAKWLIVVSCTVLCLFKTINARPYKEDSSQGLYAVYGKPRYEGEIKIDGNVQFEKVPITYFGEKPYDSNKIGLQLGAEGAAYHRPSPYRPNRPMKMAYSEPKAQVRRTPNWRGNAHQTQGNPTEFYPKPNLMLIPMASEEVETVENAVVNGATQINQDSLKTEPNLTSIQQNFVATKIPKLARFAADSVAVGKETAKPETVSDEYRASAPVISKMASELTNQPLPYIPFITKDGFYGILIPIDQLSY